MWPLLCDRGTWCICRKYQSSSACSVHAGFDRGCYFLFCFWSIFCMSKGHSTSEFCHLLEKMGKIDLMIWQNAWYNAQQIFTRSSFAIWLRFVFFPVCREAIIVTIQGCFGDNISLIFGEGWFSLRLPHKYNQILNVCSYWKATAHDGLNVIKIVEVVLMG